MAGERRINWGADATDARYRSEDTGAGANFVLAEDLDNNTVLLEYDTSVSPSEWKCRGPVNMETNDISNVGTLDATAVNTDKGDITGETFIEATRENPQSSISAGSWTNLLDTEQRDNKSELNASQQFVPSESGDYAIFGSANVNAGSDGDAVAARFYDVDSGSIVGKRLGQITVGGTGDAVFSVVGVRTLSANTTYEIQGVDFQSSFSLQTRSQIFITKEVVHP